VRQGPRRRTHFKRNVANCQGYVLMLSRSRCRMCRHCQATCPDTIVACEKKWMLEESHLQLIQLSKSLLYLFLQNQTPKPKQKQSMCKSKQGRLWLKGTFADCTNLLTFACSTQNLYTTRELQGTVCTKHCNSTRFAELQAVVRCSECHRDRFGAALDIMATEMTGSCPTRYVSRFGSFDRL